MKLENFKSGKYIDHGEYRTFSPTSVNQSWNWDNPEINVLLERATHALGELNAFTKIVPDVDVFILMHIRKEASKSSRIEGTKTTFDEELIEEIKFIKPENRDDWQEVQNYVQAMKESIDSLEKLPFSNRLIKNAHKILMGSVRGKEKSPGNFRRSDVRIGGSGFSDAVFIPPVHTEIAGLMSDLENFLHNDGIHVPVLIKTAICHYQFETIHPFLDGNGRIGRLMIPLYLISSGFLDKPSLYTSDFFEKHRESYYDAFTVVRGSNDMIHWVKFFLLAISETAEKGKTTFKNIMALRNDVESRILKFGKRAEIAHKLLTLLYRKPYVTINETADHLDVTHTTASKLLKDFIKQGILVEMSGFHRNRSFSFEKYVLLFED